MTDRFRLIYLKSNELEKNPPDQMSPFYAEKPNKSSTSTLRTSFSEAQTTSETHASRAILKQAKIDLKHTDPKVRILAVKYYLEQSHLSITMPLLQEILSDSDSGVRTEALSTLVTFGNPIVSPFLKKHLRDPDPGVRMVALRGTFQFKEKMDLNLLMQFLSDDSPWVRRKLATLLGWNQIDGVLPILIELSRDKDVKVRQAALFSLVTLYPEEGEKKLMDAMADSDPDIRQWARDQLNRMLERPAIQTADSLPR